MSYSLTCELGQPVFFPVEGEVSSFSVYSEGVVIPDTEYTGVTAVAGGVSVVSFTPHSTGEFFVRCVLVGGGVDTVHIRCNRYSEQTMLSSLLDHTEGNWSWDKSTNVMTLFKRSGDVLAVYDMTSTSVLSARTLKP